jgi:hypothetical protein
MLSVAHADAACSAGAFWAVSEVSRGLALKDVLPVQLADERPASRGGHQSQAAKVAMTRPPLAERSSRTPSGLTA